MSDPNTPNDPNDPNDPNTPNTPNTPNAPNAPNTPNTPNFVWNREQTPFTSATPGEPVSAGGGAADAASAASAGADPRFAGGFARGFAESATGAAGMPPTPGWAPASASYAVPPPPAGVPSSGEPKPALAALLGLIPGVGAMYNGQFAKGVVHVVVFAVLVFFSNHVSDLFGIFVTAWIGFMAFEAYHTAKARRDGLPLPNAFGWNDIGEHMGLGRNWPFSPGVPGAATAVATPPVNPARGGYPPAATARPYTDPASYPATGAAVPSAAPVDAAGYGVPAPVAPVVIPGAASGLAAGVAPNWAGYVPPSAFGRAPMGAASGSTVPPGQGVPYAPVNPGSAYPPLPPIDLAAASPRLPVGAIWLIGLGVLFLLGQWTPLMQVGRVWIPSLLLCGIAGLLFARRMGWTGSGAGRTGSVLPPGAPLGGATSVTVLPLGVRGAMAARVPGILLVVALLNGLHEAWVVRWNRSWPWLLIAVGVLLLVERVAMRQAASLAANGDLAQNGGL